MIVVTVVSFMSSVYHLCALSWPHALVKSDAGSSGETDSLVASFEA